MMRKSNSWNLDRQGIIFILALVFCAALLIVNWKVLTGPVDSTESAALEQLKKQNQELNRVISEQQQKIVRLEENEQKNFKINRQNQQQQQQQRSSSSSNSTQSPSAQQMESNFRKELLDYFQLHKDIASGKKDPRYVHCVVLNGWGNVLQECISCFLFAFMTKRAVIFNVGPVEKYAPFRDFLSEKDMPFDGYNLNLIQGRKEVVISRHDLACINFDDLADRELISLHLTYDWYAPNLLSNPYHGEKILDILPPNYFQIIFGYLFKLRPDIQADVDKHKREHFGSYNIGIQIRHPTVDLKGATDHKGFPVPPLDLYSEAAEQMTRFQTKAPYNEVVWFVATQNLDLIKHMQKYYGNVKVTSYNGTITTTFDPHSEGQRVSLITWWLLGECDEVITTEASSYGTTAGARTGLFPIVCTHQKFCFRRLSQTPCQDTQFLPEQPVPCMMKERKYPHQYLTSPENSCGYFKHQIYTSPEYINKLRD